MTLPLVGVRLTAQDAARYVQDMARAEAANRSFEESVRRGATTANRGFADLGQTTQRQTRALSTGFEQAGRSATTFGQTVVRGVGVATGALVALGGIRALDGFARSAFNTRLTFERELANVGALSQATGAQIQQLSDQAEQLGASTAFSATDVLGGQQFLAVAGFEVDDIITSLPSLLSTAAAAQEELATTSDIVSNALSGFNLTAEQTGRVSDVLVAALTSSNTDLVQLGTALSFAAPNAEALDVSIEGTAAAIGLLSNAGIQGSRAGTTLRGILQRLASPTAEAAAELERLGINAFDAEGRFKDLPDVLAEFERGLDGLNDQQRADSLNTIVGTIAGTGFTALLAAGSDELRQFTEELQASGGVAERVANQQLDNLAGDVTRVSSAYEGLELAITRSATPALRGFLQGVVLPSITGTTALIETLNDGGTTLEAISVGLADAAPDAARLVGEFADLQNAISGTANVAVNFDGIFGNVRALRFEDLFQFEIGGLEGQIRGAFETVDINVGDFIEFSFDADQTQLDIGDFFTLDSTAARTEINVADFVIFNTDVDRTQFNIGDFFTLDSTVQRTVVNVADFVELEFDADQTQFNIGDLFTLDSNIQRTEINVADFVTFNADAASATIDINSVIVGTYDIASAFGTIAISDIVTGSLDFGTGQGAVTLGSDLTFEFDLGAVRTSVQDQLTSLQTELSGLTFEEAAFNGALLAVGAIKGIGDTVATIDISGFANIETISNALSTADEALAGATGDGSRLADFVTQVNTSLSGLVTAIDSVDAESVGASFTGVINSVLGIFTTLNTIDDLALGGIAGSLGDLTASILGFATEFTAGIDAAAVGEVAAESASNFIGSFSAAFTEPDLPAIAGAAAGLVAAIGAGIRTAFEAGNFEQVGAEFGGIASSLVEQIASTLTDPQFAEDLGTGFADILVGITTGLSEALAGFNSAIEGSDSEIGASVTTFVSNLLSALGSALADADYGVVAAGLLDGLSGAIGNAVFGLTSGPRAGAEDIVRQQQAERLGVEPGALPELEPLSLVDIARDPQRFFAQEAEATAQVAALEQQQALDDVTSRATQALADLRAGIEVAGLPALVGELSGLGEITLAEQLIEASTAAADAARAEQDLATARQQVVASTQAQQEEEGGGFFSGVRDFFGFGPEEQRTGFGTETGIDEAAITASVNDQIAAQLNFGELPTVVAETVTTAIQGAIPPEPIIDSESVNNAVLVAAQEAIPASEIPEFPSWPDVVDFDAPRLPRFPGWRDALAFEPPPIPQFPGWGSFIDFDIPSIPSFPPWASLVGGVDIGALIPPFPGWAALVGGSAPSAPASSSPAAFQTGTESAPNTGVALVGEDGPELRLINQGDRIFPADVTSRILDIARNIATRMPTINSIPGAGMGGSVIVAPSTAITSINVETGSSGVDVFALATGIVDALGEAFSVPSFPGWPEVFNVSPVAIPPFPGWNAIIGLDDISVTIQRTENITEVIEDSGGRDIEVGPITPIPITGPSPFSFAAPAVQSAMGTMIEASETVVNNVVNNFNLATTSLRSTEDVETDFALMERLGALA